MVTGLTVNTSKATISVEHGSYIVIADASTTSAVNVITASGAVVFRSIATRISGLAPGLYIVTVENTAAKVIIR